jgi:hypothetical protein
MAKETLPPHLFADGDLKRCSVCGHPFDPDVKPSMSVLFAAHLLKDHKPGQTTEDVNQAAARIVREATGQE